MSATEKTRLRYDAGGNPALAKDRFEARIDLLQSGVIAAGLRGLAELEPKRTEQLRLIRVGAR